MNAVLIVGLVVIFGSLNANYLSAFSLRLIVRNLAINLIVSIGLTFTILEGSLDLSVAEVYALSAITTVLYEPIIGPLVLVVSVCLGLACGLANSLIMIKGRIPSFIATIGTMMIVRGIAMWLSGGWFIIMSAKTMNPVFAALTIGELIPGVANYILWSVMIFGISIIVCFRTRLGRRIYAVGSNYTAARISGIDIGRHQVMAFMVCSVLAAIAGVLVASRSEGASIGLDTNILLPAISAVVVGGTSITGGQGGPHRTLIGTLALTMLVNGLNMTEVNIYLQQVIYGIVVILGIALTIDRKKLKFIR